MLFILMTLLTNNQIRKELISNQICLCIENKQTVLLSVTPKILK